VNWYVVMGFVAIFSFSNAILPPPGLKPPFRGSDGQMYNSFRWVVCWEAKFGTVTVWMAIAHLWFLRILYPVWAHWDAWQHDFTRERGGEGTRGRGGDCTRGRGNDFTRGRGNDFTRERGNEGATLRSYCNILSAGKEISSPNPVIPCFHW
jgi:hypothetical protein